ncbi:MAG: C25 family cysteine peptidase [Planctomycetota bacterium]
MERREILLGKWTVAILIGLAAVGDGTIPSRAYAQSVGPTSTVLVVRPVGWGPALREWIAYRGREYHIVELDSAKNSEEQRVAILQAVANAQPPVSALLLCGDVMVEVPLVAGEQTKQGMKKKYRVLTPGVTLETTIKIGAVTTPELGTDATYGDIDGDGCPDLAVGRIPVKTPAELERMLRRSIDYEAIQPGEWNDAVHVTAGVGGFGYIADSAIEAVTRRFLTEGIPDHFHLHMTYASCTSTYCPNPFQLRDSYIERINQGGLFWVYIGHGSVTQLDTMQVGNDFLPIGDAADAARFKSTSRPPIAILLACFTGAFDAVPDCFSERLLQQPTGPIAVISGSRVTMPYGLSQFASEMINGCFRDRIPTLGQVVLQAKQRIWELDETEDSSMASGVTIPEVTDKKDSVDASKESAPEKRLDIRKRYRRIVTDMARALSPGDHSLIGERREHVRLMNLFGDPLLRIPYPTNIDLQVPASIHASESLVVEGISPIAGRLVIELALVRDRLPNDAIPVASYEGTQAQHDQMQRTYERSNELVVLRDETSTIRGGFHREFHVPDDLKGRYVLSAYIYGENTWAVGSRRIIIRQPK